MSETGHQPTHHEHSGHSESLLDLAKKHPAGAAIMGVGAVLLILRLRAGARLSGAGPINIPAGSGPPNYAAVGGQGGTMSGPDVSALQQQTGQALGAIEQQIQALSAAASQHAQASGYGGSPYPMNYNPAQGAYAGFGAVSQDLGMYAAASAATLPDACNYSNCRGIFGCIGHFFTATATCLWRGVQTVGLAGAGLVASPQGIGALTSYLTGGAGQVPGAVAGYPGYNGPIGGYGGYGYTPGIAPGPSFGYGGGASIVPAYQGGYGGYVGQSQVTAANAGYTQPPPLVE